MSLEDEIRQISGSDQATAGLESVAAMFSGFFQKLVSDKLTREEALHLTSAAVTAFFAESFRKQQ